jgi:putative flippase GtrA
MYKKIASQLWQASFFRFVFVGGISTLIQFGVLSAGVELLVIHATHASALGYLISAIFNYLMNYYLTFDSEIAHIEAASKFLVVVFVGLSVNTVMFFLFIKIVHLYLVAQAGATLCAIGINFLLHRHWIYRK